MDVAGKIESDKKKGPNASPVIVQTAEGFYKKQPQEIMHEFENSDQSHAAKKREEERAKMKADM